MRYVSLLKTLFAIASETTLAGAIRFCRYKMRLSRTVLPTQYPNKTSKPGIGILGAGNYAAEVSLPIIQALKQPICGIQSARGLTATALSAVYGLPAYPQESSLLSDPDCNAFLIATPHHQHPKQILQALETQRYTYCEKPVAIDEAGLEMLCQHPSVSTDTKIMVGFNRRFAPAIKTLLKTPWFSHENAIEIQYRVNFGPKVNNMMSDPLIGGRRLHGAACHYVDLIAYLTGSPIDALNCIALKRYNTLDYDTFTAHFRLASGSIATLIFTSDGSRAYGPKETIQITSLGHVVTICDFKRLQIDKHTQHFYRHTYGAYDCLKAFFAAKENRQPVPISLSDGIRATRVTLAMQQSLEQGGVLVAV